MIIHFPKSMASTSDDIFEDIFNIDTQPPSIYGQPNQYTMAVSEGGYAFRFVGEESIRIRELKCPICLLVLKAPHLTDCCGGHFCKSCIDGVKGQNKPCPICRGDFKTMINKKVEREIQLLPIYCVNSSKGCTWTGAIKDLDNHIADGNAKVTAQAKKSTSLCQYQDLRCPLGCEEYILRKDILDHRTNVCLQRSFACLHCGTRDTFTHISAKHYPICKQFPLQCPNACTKDTILRKKMPEHLDVCPLQPVVCPYAKYGCKSSVVRRDHEKHVKDAVHTHLEMVTKSYEKLEEEAKNLSVEIPLQKKVNRKVIVKKGGLLPEVTDIKVVAICSDLGFNVGTNKLLNDQLKGMLQLIVDRRYQQSKPARFDVFTIHCPPSTINCRFLVVANLVDRTIGTLPVHNKYLQQILHSVFKEADTLEMPSVAIAPHTFRVGGFVDSVLSTFIKVFNQYHFTNDEFLTDVRFLAPTSSMVEQLIFEAEQFTDKQLSILL